METGGDVATCRDCVIEMFQARCVEGRRLQDIGRAQPDDVAFTNLLAATARQLEASPDLEAVAALRRAFVET